jgi:hypothetical protein
VECGLKACIAKLTGQHDFPRPVKFVQDCYTHDMEKLIRRADLEEELALAVAASSAFDDNWDIAQEWTETSRYMQKTQAEAQELYDAITHVTDGVLPWIRIHW